jgi:hypothetical protein
MKQDNTTAEFREQLQSNQVSPSDVIQILSTLQQDPWLESESYHGDLLFELKIYLNRQQNDATWKHIKCDFERLYDEAVAQV